MSPAADCVRTSGIHEYSSLVTYGSNAFMLRRQPERLVPGVEWRAQSGVLVVHIDDHLRCGLEIRARGRGRREVGDDEVVDYESVEWIVGREYRTLRRLIRLQDSRHGNEDEEQNAYPRPSSYQQ
jgi:hypothetical protein